MLDTENATVGELARSLTPKDRKAAERRMFWLDHGIFRSVWSNFGEVAPGVYRSNHPPHGRLKAYKDMGILSILNLRGTPKKAHHILEVESCEQLGLQLFSIAMQARFAPLAQDLQQLFETFDTIPRPFLMHCKSGADRAGMASALYLLDQGESVERAKQELSFKYLHIKHSKTGVQDHFLDAYAARLRKGPISIRDWVATEYSARILTDSFAKVRRLPI